MVLMFGCGMLATVIYVWATQPARFTETTGILLICASALAISYPFVSRIVIKIKANKGIEADITTINEHTEERALKNMEKRPDAKAVAERLAKEFEEMPKQKEEKVLL